MKRMKKIVSILLAMVMVLGMSLTVFAADNNQHTITVTQNSADKTEHTYDAYQIFAGDLAEKEGKKVLSNIIWGSGVNGDALLKALQADETFNVVAGENESDPKTNAFAGCTTAAQVAQVLSGDAFGSSTVSTSTLTDAFARVVENNLTKTVAGTATGEGTVEIEVTGSGYYLIKDQDGTVDTVANGAYSRFMLEVVGDATATVKSEVPSGDKKVYVNGTELGDANNASIGSHVSYQITSKVPNHVGYNYYYFIMNDTLSEGLTFDGVGSVAVKVGDATLKQGVIGEDGKITEEGDYYVYTGATVAPKTFRLAFANIMDYTVGADIVVTYSATVNDKAVVGTTGNPNTWNLQYSNNPDDTFDGERPDGENTPGLPADEENEALGQTPDEKTLTYVTELDITKYANSVAEDHLLAGAEFTLTGISKQVVLNTVDYYEAAENGTYYLLLDGTYTETAPTGTAYVEIGVGTKDTTTGYIKDENGGYVVPTDKTAYEGQTLYKLVKGTADKYADVNTKYEKKTATETTYVDAVVSIELTTGEDGKISFKDLGAGEYTLTETVTPEGFNTIEPIKFEIVFTAPDRGVVTGDETCIWDIVVKEGSFEVSESGNGNSLGGVFSANIINQSGSLLPSTGGIGTTIFYVVGAVLVIGAGILLVAKKRMSNR
ncbi:isopeptide-forming domain-containing fimbrial protein [Acetatifactor aquisgranensis]|uniref:isopeptide-forming domain-containing fimbrial protein n=1 Tax=Acetatifactor aquisgranensis TaxID=2941233 RepID=UPI00203BA392|nr:isopeptide-forming domain-containing fimbrial protein [Acetatifactor aquisgranensis]